MISRLQLRVCVRIKVIRGDFDKTCESGVSGKNSQLS